MSRRVLPAALAALLAAAPALAAPSVHILRLQSREAFLRGTLAGISIDPHGTLRLAPRAERLTPLDEPFVLSAAPHPEGWVVGTGNAGRVLLVERSGAVRQLFATEEPEVFAVWADGDGTVYAGSSPEGKVYRHRGGATETFFAPGETYVWGLAGAPGGDLLVATGTQGKLFRVDRQGEGRVVWDSDDTHVRTVLVLPDGAVLAGTAGTGLIVRIDGSRVRTLHDAIQPEIAALAVAPDGTAWAAAVASEASQVQLSAPQQSEKGDQEESEGAGEVTVVVVEEGSASPESVGSRPPGFKGPRSEILRITPGGSVVSAARLDDETVHSLLWSGDRLWVGTGLEGKVYTVRDRDLVLENDVDERQVMAVVPDEDGMPAFATTNAGAFYRLERGGARRGTYTSAVLDAGHIARFGTFRWRGGAPAGTEVAFSFRSGISADPDRTWTEWTPARQGQELSLAEVPAGRYLQWRAELSGNGGATPALTGGEVSFRQENLAPRITELEVLEPGQILVPYNFNPGEQVYEPAHPTRDGIFTSLEPASSDGDRRLKTLWKKGYRTLRWKAVDPNDDDLVYTLDFRSDEPEGEWLRVVDKLTETHYSFDATALPDGVYRFRLQAADRNPGEEGEGLSDRRVSEPVVVDHTPPVVGRVQRSGEGLTVSVSDAQNPIREAAYSVDGGPWEPAPPADGLLDGRTETLHLTVPAGARLVILRLSDAAFNVTTVDLSGEVR